MKRSVLVSFFAFVLPHAPLERPCRLLRPLYFRRQHLGFGQQRHRSGARRDPGSDLGKQFHPVFPLCVGALHQRSSVGANPRIQARPQRQPLAGRRQRLCLWRSPDRAARDPSRRLSQPRGADCIFLIPIQPLNSERCALRGRRRRAERARRPCGDRRLRRQFGLYRRYYSINYRGLRRRHPDDRFRARGRGREKHRRLERAGHRTDAGGPCPGPPGLGARNRARLDDERRIGGRDRQRPRRQTLRHLWPAQRCRCKSRRLWSVERHRRLRPVS